MSDPSYTRELLRDNEDTFELRTISYQNLLAKYTALRGVDELLDQEKSDFSNSLNHRIKQIWVKSRWPDLTVVVEKTLRAIDTPSLKVENGVRIDNIDDLFEVYSVLKRTLMKIIQRSGFHFIY